MIRYWLSLIFCCVFFFKQKTAYEMRISDWSSDVCSSDLALRPRSPSPRSSVRSSRCRYLSCWSASPSGSDAAGFRPLSPRKTDLHDRPNLLPLAQARRTRSEEHTSELQSLMRISYAVFCLKKKNNIHHLFIIFSILFITLK